MRPYPLIKNCAGLNNRVDPVSDVPVPDLSECVNMWITDKNKAEVAVGYTARVAQTDSHSLYCKGPGYPAFFVQDRTSDAAIYQLAADARSSADIRSGLTKGVRVAFCTVGTQTFYCNGIVSGMIEDGVSSAWPDQTAHIGATTARVFYPAPIGNHLEYWQSCMWIAVGPTIYVSEPATVGKFHMADRFFQFASDVRMMKGVAGGVWVSTADEIGFIAKDEDFKSMRWVAHESKAQAHEWSACHELVDLSQTKLQIPGESALWSSDDGMCVGTQDGQLIVTTEDRLIYPTGDMGATVADNGKCFNSIW